MDIFNPSKFSLKTLGCKVNQYESQVLRERLVSRGFEEAPLEYADTVIINSCTVTSLSDKKTRQLARSLKKRKPSVTIVITGCGAVEENDIRSYSHISEIDIVVPNHSKYEIPAILRAFASCGLSHTNLTCSPKQQPGKGEDGYTFDSDIPYNSMLSFGHCSTAPGHSLTTKGEFDREGDEPVKVGGGNSGITYFKGHSRAFVKIQDGCDNRCAYCKVTLVRGSSRSRNKTEIISEVRTLVSRGYREIVLTGICVGGWRGNNKESLPDLITEINTLAGDFRVRISSIEPNYVDEKFIQVLSVSDKVCAHLHIPLQSGSERILSLMKRGYGTGYFAGIIDRLRAKIPGIGISTDIITGFPSETEDDFSRTRDFLLKMRPSRLHVFRYSPRKGTEATAIRGPVPFNISKRRSETLLEMGSKFQADFYKSYIGKDINVLIESSKNGFSMGYSGEYVRVSLKASSIPTGQIVKCTSNSFDKSKNCLIAADVCQQYC